MDLTVLIGSCDKYFFLWSDFAWRFNNFIGQFMEPNIDKYIISETIAYSGTDFKTILCGKIPYSTCLGTALEKVKTKYVLWLQDDYFITNSLTRGIEWYISIMNEHNIDRIGIYPDYPLTHFDGELMGLKRLGPNCRYSISMQASIWNTEFFKKCLGPTETPWEFELNGTKRLNKTSHNSYLHIVERWYLEACKKGTLTANYYRLRRPCADNKTNIK